MTTRPRITIPALIKQNDVIEVRTVITHVMETGQRKDADGRPVPRNIINSVRAFYRGKPVFSATLHPGTAANPFVAFQFRATTPGELSVVWADDAGRLMTEKVDITFV